MKIHWRILLIVCDLLVVALVVMPFRWVDVPRSPSPYDQSVQIGMSFDEAIANLGNPQLESAYWKKANGHVHVLSYSGDRTISSVNFHAEKMGPAWLSQQQYWRIGLTAIGILLGFVVLPSDVKGWRSIVLKVSVPILYGLGAAALSAMAWTWFNTFLSK